MKRLISLKMLLLERTLIMFKVIKHLGEVIIFLGKGADYAQEWLGFNNEASYPSMDELTWSKVLTKSKAQIERLSAAEKLDIYLGYKDFRITKRELNARGPYTPDIYSWEGFCNGVRAAGALTNEPIKQITEKNPDGIEVVFHPADLKILAGASYFYLTPNGYGQIGSNYSIKPNAGVFDIIIRLILGEKEKVFFFDNSQTDQIWNHTALGYERKITENKRPIAAADNAPANSTHLIVYQTTFYNMGELGSMDIIDGPTKPRIASKNNCCTEINTYNYILFLDASNNIVEGRWKNNFYPDVIWFGNGRGDDQIMQMGLTRILVKNSEEIRLCHLTKLLNS
jgi:hypothetical protein